MNIKLNLVVASMSILGLIATPSGVAYAKKHHKRHHHRHHHARVHREAVAADYKDMGSLPVQPAPMETVCSVSPTVAVWDDMTQNSGRALPSACNPGWWNRIAVSGGLNFDLLKFGNRNADFTGVNYQRFSINDAYINLSATANDWARGFVSLSFSNPTASSVDISDDDFVSARSGYGANYSSNAVSNFFGGNRINASSINLEQAYVVLGNMDASPVFVQIGKGFADFGRYEIHPITRSMTQVLSEVLATQAKVGFITPMGFNGSLYAFDTAVNKANNGRTQTVWGASLGYDVSNEQLGYDVGLGYLSNVWGVNDVALVAPFGGYNSSKASWNIYGDVNSGPFSLNARYVAYSRLNVLDMPNVGRTAGLKPWAFGLQAGYNFEGMGKNQNIYLGYQQSRQTATIGLPKNRWVLGYNIDAWKYTNLALEYQRDKDHSVAAAAANGIPDHSYNLLSLRAAVKFS